MSCSINAGASYTAVHTALACEGSTMALHCPEEGQVVRVITNGKMTNAGENIRPESEFPTQIASANYGRLNGAVCHDRYGPPQWEDAMCGAGENTVNNVRAS